MANGGCCVSRVGFLHHEGSHRFTDNVTASQYYALFTRCFDFITLQQFEYAVRSGRYVTGQSDRHASYVNGMETVYVFAIVDGFDYFLFGDVLGQRELYDEAVHVGIFVKFAYFGQAFTFAATYVSLPPSCPTRIAAKWGRLPPLATISATSSAISCFTCSEMAFPSIRVMFNSILVMGKSRIICRTLQVKGKERKELVFVKS